MNWPDDFINKIICGDNLSVMKKMPDESIDMALTSPPYWGLRDYGFKQIFGGDPDCKHIWTTENVYHDNLRFRDPNKKAKVGHNKNPKVYSDPKLKQGDCIYCGAWKGQLGLEPTPELYIEHLTEIFNEVKRILKKEGTLWLNIGDTYSTHTSKRSGQFGKDIKEGFDDIYSQKRILPLQEKCLCMIPERLAWSLIQNGWILRNKIPWIKPNYMPSSAKDRYTNKWEYIFYFVKSRKNYFDLDSVREPHKGTGGGPGFGANALQQNRNYEQREHPKGKNPGDIWIINTQPCPFKNIHFATFPEKLCKKAIIPGSPEEVCKKCGKARERIYKSKFTDHNGQTKTAYDKEISNAGRLARLRQAAREKGAEYQNEKEFIGYTDCGCKAGFDGGIVLDPFCGVGTALYVAKELRRRFIGIDIKKEYCEMAEKRLAQRVL